MKKVKLKNAEKTFNGITKMTKLIQKNLIGFDEHITVQNDIHPEMDFEVHLNLNNEIEEISLVFNSSSGNDLVVPIENPYEVADAVKFFMLEKQEPLASVMTALDALISFESKNYLEIEVDFQKSDEVNLYFKHDFYEYNIIIDSDSISITKDEFEFDNNDDEYEFEEKRERLEQAKLELEELQKEIDDLEDELND